MSQKWHENPFLLSHVSGRDAPGHMISSPPVKMACCVWTEEETTKRNNRTVLQNDSLQRNKSMSDSCELDKNILLTCWTTFNGNTYNVKLKFRDIDFVLQKKRNCHGRAVADRTCVDVVCE